MNWILDEVRESIKNKITVCESFMELCDSQIKLYKDRYSTNDLQVACNYEYWRACKIRTAYEIKDLKEILQDDNIVVLLLSENYYKSATCLNEMGAAWIRELPMIRILLPGFKVEKVEGVIDNSLDNSSVYNDDLRNTIEWLHNRKIVKTKNFYLGYTDRTITVDTDTSSYNTYLVLGNVIYAYDCEYIKNNVMDNLKKISPNIDEYDVERLLRSINLRFDIGELDITPNREQLLYSDKTNKALVSRFWDAYDEMKEVLKKSEDCNYNDLIEYYHKIISLGSIKFDRYSVPSLVISGGNNKTEFRFKEKQRTEIFNQSLRSLFNFPIYYNVIKDNKFYNGGRIKKNETLSPYEIIVNRKLGDDVKIYLCSLDDLKSPLFKNYISCTLRNGIVITPVTIKQLFGHSSTYDINVLKEVWRYIKDHAIKVTKDEYYNDYLKARKNYNIALRNVNANNNVNIRVTIAKYSYNGYRESTDTYPLNKLTNYLREYKVRNKSNKEGIILYCCLEDECFKLLKTLSKNILGSNVNVVAIPKTHYKYVESNKPKNWVHLSKIINPNNKKIVKTFTYIKYGIEERTYCLR